MFIWVVVYIDICEVYFEYVFVIKCDNSKYNICIYVI